MEEDPRLYEPVGAGYSKAPALNFSTGGHDAHMEEDPRLYEPVGAGEAPPAPNFPTGGHDDAHMEEYTPPPQLSYLDRLRLSLPPSTPKIPTIEEFTDLLKESPNWSAALENNWSILSQPAKMSYIRWFYSDRKQSLSDLLYKNGGDAPITDYALIHFFEKFTKESLGGSRRRRRRRSLPKSSRKYKKSAKRVFRKKSRSTRRR